MQTHEPVSGKTAAAAVVDLEPVESWTSHILNASHPASAAKDALTAFAVEMDAPFLAVYRTFTGVTGQMELRLDEAISLFPETSVQLDPLGDAVIQTWDAELSALNRVVRPAADLRAEMSDLLAITDARVLVAQPVRVGARLVAVLLVASRVDVDHWEAGLDRLCQQAAEAISIAILRERSRNYARINAVLAYAFDIILVLGSDASILYHTPTFARVLGNAFDDFIGKSAFDSIHPDDRPRVATAFDKLLDEPGGQRRIEVRLKHHNGSWRHFEALGTNQIDNPLIGGIVVTAYDVTDRKQLERKLNWQALHDPLTKLANRSLLLNDLRRALARAQRSGNVVGVLFLDLDGFKAVNDHFGHPTGDQLLVQIADRLLACVRAGETVARLGGDEFVVLLEALTSSADAERAAARILDAVRMPIRLSHGNVDITASMGISLSSGEPVDPDDLLIRADTALYQAKHAGRARYEFNEPI